jgi:hypothetical protein
MWCRATAPSAARRLGLVASGCVFAFGCSGSAPSPRNPAANVARSTPPVLPQSGDRRGALDRLEDAVVLFQSSPRRAGKEQAARVLARFAEVLTGVAPSESVTVRDLSRELRSSSAASLTHAHLIVRALSAARTALLSVETPSGRRDGYRSALDALARDVGVIRDTSPLDEQRAAISQAFRSAANAAFVAEGWEPPFRPVTPNPREVQSAHGYEVELEQARNAALALASAEWTSGRAEAAGALLALADLVVAALPAEGSSNDVAQLRFQAKALRESKSSFGEASWVKAALTSALRVLERSRGGSVSASSLAARRSVDGIAERSTLGLQRAIVQDALRATIDAFGEVGVGACSDSATTDGTAGD